EQGKLGQNYRKTMLCPQKDNQIPFPSGTSGKIDVFFNSLLTGSMNKIATLFHPKIYGGTMLLTLNSSTGKKRIYY
ncbi:hypothetical protein, partial [Thiolapillus sp.]|uniref:hypothetical protein n=1 Tax=Thiolapillus sp. TaxID=2017437 RepID=UPI003AF95437